MKYLFLVCFYLSLSLPAFCQWDIFNNPPEIDRIRDYGPIPENAGNQTIILTGISDGDDNKEQNITITASTNNANLISNLEVEYDQGTSAVLSFTPKLNVNGKAEITVKLDDGQNWRNITESSFEVTVFAVNSKPSFQLSSELVSIDENEGKITIKKFASDIDDGDPELEQKLNFKLTVVSITGNLTFRTSPTIEVKNGDLKFEINRDRYGEAKVSVLLIDNGGTKNGGIDTSDESIFYIKVVGSNKPPTLNDIPSPLTLVEDAGEQIVDLTGISSGVIDNQDLIISAVSDNQELISNINIEYITGETTAKLMFSPRSNQFGTAVITVTIDNGQTQNNTVSKQFSVIVNPVADTPTVTDAILKGSKQTTSGLVISKNPVDGNEVTHIKINEIINGTLYLNNGVSQIQNNEFITFAEGNKGLKFTPNDGSSDPGSFKIQAATGADDSHLGGAIITAQIIIDNDPPVIISIPDSISEISKQYSYEVKASDPNELDVLTFTIIIPQFIQPWLKVVDNQDRTVTIFGTPPSGSAGLYEIYIKVEDQFGEYDEQFYNLSVNELNKKPELLPFSIAIQEDETIFFVKEDFNLRFSDADGDTLHSIKVASVPQFGTLKLNGVELGLNNIIKSDEINSFTYVPEKDYFGLDIFDWNASDGKDYAITPQRISVFISSVNDPPEILNFESNPFTFEYGDESIAITDSGMVVDVDGDKIEKAVVSFTKNYIQGEDTLFYEFIEGLNYEWQDITGVLFIRGITTPAIYQDAVQSLRYVNLNRLAPEGTFRELEIILYDSDTCSIPYMRRIDFENTFVDLDIPTGFTPNDDKVNDTWEIDNLNRYENFQIAVYSRTGKMIFESESYLKEWDGRHNGELVPAGNYYYLININKFEKVYKGTVFVLR